MIAAPLESHYNNFDKTECSLYIKYIIYNTSVPAFLSYYMYNDIDSFPGSPSPFLTLLRVNFMHKKEKERERLGTRLTITYYMPLLYLSPLCGD